MNEEVHMGDEALETPEMPPEVPEEMEQEVLEQDDLFGQLQKAQAQCEEYLSLAQRVQADFDNYRRRNNAACSEAYDNGRSAIIEQILPVVDNLERAVDATRDPAMQEGVALVLKQLLGLMEKWGVEKIDRAGEPFDPNLENAVLQGAEDEGEPNTVCAVLQKGYKVGSRVLRYAMVKVVAG